MNTLSEETKTFIAEAVQYLEKPSFLIRATDLLGKPIEGGVRLLPETAQKVVNHATHSSLELVFKVALSSLRRNGAVETIAPISPEAGFERSLHLASRTQLKHSITTLLTGATSGFFGLPALALELPLTSTVMLRSIASVAADFGEDLNQRETQLDCMMVFAMGAPSRGDDEMESAYFTTRVATAKLVQEAAAFIAGKSQKELLEALARGAAPVLAKLLTVVTARFQIVVTEKFLAQAVPVLGAAAGGLLNVAFTQHFNHVARFHFGIRKLEREYGREVVQAYYKQCLKG